MAVYFEARSEPIRGRYAVAEVIVNRMHDKRFPDTICGVVKEDRGPESYDCQFSFMCDGKSDTPDDVLAWDQAYVLAEDVLLNQHITNYTHGAKYYTQPNVTAKWTKPLTVTAQIGNHVFMSDGVSFADN